MSLSDAAEQDYRDLIHKARPSVSDEHLCAVCGIEIKRVPGGRGPTYVHTDTGAVAGRGSEHYPISAGPDDEGDWRVCACGEDLYSVHACPHVPAAECGCPEWTTGVEHLPGLCLLEEEK